MESIDAFSADYTSARSRFRQLSQQLSDNIDSYPVLSQAENLSIDVVTLGNLQAKKIVIISSGLHGIEGFVGSAIQLAFLDGLLCHEISLKDCCAVLIHAINPYGFKYLRRVNESNIDLNRNFLLNFNQMPSSTGYTKFNPLLNPSAEISNLDFFNLKAYFYICRYGLRSLRQSILAGQYEFPKGLFFGGNSLAQSTKLIQEILQGISPLDKMIFHIDIHSGLGDYADYTLLFNNNTYLNRLDSYRSRFDTSKIEKIGEDKGITSKISGTVSDYFSRMMGDDYHHIGLEFGTYSNIKLLKAMRLENTSHHYPDGNRRSREKIKAEFLECFCPVDLYWRKTVVEDGLKVIRQAMY